MTSSETPCLHRRQPRRRDRLHGRLPEYGEQRWYTSALAAEQVSFSWRKMPPKTGGRGSYGHRHPGQEEIFFVIAGVVTFKIDDVVFDAGPQTAGRIGGHAFRSIHNDTAQPRADADPSSPAPCALRELSTTRLDIRRSTR